MFAVRAAYMLWLSFDISDNLSRLVQRVATAASWNGETSVHGAVTVKLERILSNALALHDSNDRISPAKGKKRKMKRSVIRSLAGARDQASRNFILYGEKHEEVGGVLWTFWRLFNGSLLYQEGLWISTRILIIQVAQILIGSFTIVVLFIFTRYAADSADDFRRGLDPSTTPDWIYDLVPTGAMLTGSLVPATVVAMALMVITIAIYIPR